MHDRSSIMLDMNKLSMDRQVQVIAALVEGNSIRSIERMTGIHRDTVMRLMVRVADGCDLLLDGMMNGLTCQRIQLDELWAYVAMKQKTANRLMRSHEEIGDVYTFVAIDADTKLIPCFHIGRRTTDDTEIFVNDLRERIIGRVQITSDSFRPYLGAISRAFGTDVDYAQQHKTFASELNTGRGRYSPPVLLKCDKANQIGNPDEDHVSTAFVERQNLTMRMAMRRFTRLTNGFSKKRENLVAAVCLHFAHYNLCRTHKTIKATPAVAHGLEQHVWSIEELIAAADVASSQREAASN